MSALMNRLVRRSLPVFALTLIAASAAYADGPSITVYSSADPAGFDPQQFISQQRMGYNPQAAWQVPGFGVVRETRSINLDAGFSELRFTDVAQFIDPTTVSFTDLTNAGGTQVLEQNFEFDLINTQKLYEKYIDQDVTLEVAGPNGEPIMVQGTVLAVNGGMFIIETPAGIEFVSQGSQQVKLPPLPLDDFVTKPTLVWKLHAEQGGQHDIQTAYQTAGITWRSDYNLVLNPSDTKADLGAWVTMMNLSGAAYKNAQLKLIAGDVQRVESNQYAGARFNRTAETLAMDSVGFQEKTFFEYHMYTLPRRTDILDNSTQQITLFPTARDVNVEKVLVYYGLPQASYWYGPNPQTDRNLGSQANKKVDVYVRFKNAEANNLGMPLPAGKVRVYKEDDADGALEFVGEDLIDHTAREEELLIKLGQAFDVVGDRLQTDFAVDSRRDTMEEMIKITLRNRKNENAKVIVKENLYRWVNWEIVNATDEFKKIDSRTIHFEANLEPDEEKTITYTVRYSW